MPPIETVTHRPARWNLFSQETTYDELVGHFIRGGKHSLEAFKCADAMWKKMTGNAPTMSMYDDDFLDSNNRKRYDTKGSCSRPPYGSDASRTNLFLVVDVIPVLLKIASVK